MKNGHNPHTDGNTQETFFTHRHTHLHPKDLGKRTDAAVTSEPNPSVIVAQ